MSKELGTSCSLLPFPRLLDSILHRCRSDQTLGSDAQVFHASISRLFCQDWGTCWWVLCHITANSSACLVPSHVFHVCRGTANGYLHTYDLYVLLKCLSWSLVIFLFCPFLRNTAPPAVFWWLLLSIPFPGLSFWTNYAFILKSGSFSLFHQSYRTLPWAITPVPNVFSCCFGAEHWTRGFDHTRHPLCFWATFPSPDSHSSP